MELLLEDSASERDYWRISESLELELSFVELFKLRFGLNLVDVCMDYEHEPVGELIYLFDDKSKYTYDGIFYGLYNCGKKEEIGTRGFGVEELP